MSSGDTVPPSPLDKPLHQLTEDDISQLTREDCRRYLKEKGMRRPSWNKSQAIQQVISLKTLLETSPDSDAGVSRKKLHFPRPEIPQRVTLASNDSDNGRRDESQSPISVSAAEDSVPYGRIDPPVTTYLSRDRLGSHIDSVSPRTTAATHGLVEQMTIFYCGKVDVYDDMPIEKARTIMQLAASPLYYPQVSPSDGFSTLGPYLCHLQNPSAKVGPGSPGTVFSTFQTVKMAGISQLQKEESNLSREDNQEGASSRKASVQRYLEKRKDRFKRKVGMPSSTSLDIYLNHRVGDRSPNEQLSRSDACSHPQPRFPHTTTRCSSVENLTRCGNLPVDLNYKDDEGHLVGRMNGPCNEAFSPHTMS